MTVFRVLHLGRVLIAAAALQIGAACADPALPPTPSAWARIAPALEHAAPADLQAAYLACERQAATILLDFGMAAQCSAIYEALKERVFGGDFQRLMAWWSQQKKQAAQRSSTLPQHAPGER